MIIRDNEIYDALTFRRGLGRAIKGVVRITSRSERTNQQPATSLATGWLITDTLVVICDYVLAQHPNEVSREFFCHLPAARPGM